MTGPFAQPTMGRWCLAALYIAASFRVVPRIFILCDWSAQPDIESYSKFFLAFFIWFVLGVNIIFDWDWLYGERSDDGVKK